ncbi:MAG: molybdenum cofactor biosynthesis protein [Halanaerobiaceae bacterium]|jgi:molybdenum cofactor synthesis domain-containing protein|nr:molybdenum cofactor biosynthesis protein [Halanaerobiaceae bacterium]
MIRVAVLTIADKETAEEKSIGEGVFEELLESINGVVEYKKNLLEDFRVIQEELFNITEKGLADLVLTIGGTGFARKNVTPEATMAVIEKEVPGITEYIRQETAKKIPEVVLSRGRAGIRKAALIVNLPDRKEEIIESLKALVKVIPEGIKILKSDFPQQRYNFMKLW